MELRRGAHGWAAADLLPLVLAAAIPLLFLHIMYQPSFRLGPIGLDAADLAIALVLCAALVSGRRFGWQRLAPARWLWLANAALLALFAASCFWRPVVDARSHLTTAAHLVEYALLAPAVVLLLRRVVDVMRFLVVYVAWSAAASLWGLLQFLGLVNEFLGKRPAQREVSFIGHESFGAFTGSALLVGVALFTLGDRRRAAWVAIVSGGLGVVLDASISVYGGVALATVVLAASARRARLMPARRLAALAAVLVVLGLGVEALRASDMSAYLADLGLRQAQTQGSGVQSGAQRLLLLYIGVRIWESHPWLGVGFERSADRYQPYLAAAHRRFPSQPALAFPSPTHPWGVQNYWLQVLADTGIAGFALAVATFAAGVALAARGVARNPVVAFVGAAWLLSVAGAWTAIGIVAGIPLDAITALGLGLAAAAGCVDRAPGLT